MNQGRLHPTVLKLYEKLGRTENLNRREGKKSYGWTNRSVHKEY